MASITASSVAVRAVVGRKSFLAGNARVAAAAPKTVNKARFTVRAADEVRDCFYRVTYGVPGRARAIHARCAMPPKRAFGEGRDTPTAIAVARVVRRSSARRGTATEPKAMRENTRGFFFDFFGRARGGPIAGPVLAIPAAIGAHRASRTTPTSPKRAWLTVRAFPPLPEPS